MSFTENFRSLPIAALLLSGTQMNVSRTDETRYRRHLSKANPLTLYIKTSYFLSRIQLARFTIAEAAWSDWLSMQPTNRISSHYPAHVFSDQPIPRKDTIGDNGREPSDYQRVADRYLAGYLRWNIILLSKMQDFLITVGVFTACAMSQTDDSITGRQGANQELVMPEF